MMCFVGWRLDVAHVSMPYLRSIGQRADKHARNDGDIQQQLHCVVHHADAIHMHYGDVRRWLGSAGSYAHTSHACGTNLAHSRCDNHVAATLPHSSLDDAHGPVRGSHQVVVDARTRSIER